MVCEYKPRTQVRPSHLGLFPCPSLKLLPATVQVIVANGIGLFSALVATLATHESVE